MLVLMYSFKEIIDIMSSLLRNEQLISSYNPKLICYLQKAYYIKIHKTFIFWDKWGKGTSSNLPIPTPLAHHQIIIILKKAFRYKMSCKMPVKSVNSLGYQSFWCMCTVEWDNWDDNNSK